MQSTLAGFLKRPRNEESAKLIVDISHEPVVEIFHEPVRKISHESIGGISHEPIGANNFLHTNLNLNVFIEDDFYTQQPYLLNEPNPPFLEE